MSVVPEFVHILQRQGLLSPEQVDECRIAVQQTGCSWEQALGRLDLVTTEEILLAWGDVLHLRVLDLVEMAIPPGIIQLVPESVARENVLLPVAREGNLLILAVSAPLSSDLLEKLVFILRRQVQMALASREQILEAIDRYYGQAKTESVDSMLAERVEAGGMFPEAEEEAPAMPAPQAPSAPGAVRPGPAPTMAGVPQPLPAAVERGATSAVRPNVERRATVRYYERMNPERLYPLLVILSRAEMERIQQANVGQKQSETFQVRTDRLVEIEPILPGCDCYPPRVQVPVTGGQIQAEFWVAPRVVGKLRSARVVVRQEGHLLAEVPLEASVGKQVITWVMAGLSLVLPFVLLLLKHFRLDFDSQRAEGYGLYALAAGKLIEMLTPETLTVALLLVTGGLYLWLRPRQRDQFWEVKER